MLMVKLVAWNLERKSASNWLRRVSTGDVPTAVVEERKRLSNLLTRKHKTLARKKIMKYLQS